ncbi:MAG: tryptophan synthase subunit alpha [Fibrobacteres bacterium CG2_30_45_31]|nr:MAG: tryptophan synthase subunit alpha [Fibrobacteres bacterium CG2_30_45_31]
MSAENSPRLMAHLVAGFPNHETSLAVADALVAGGAKILEIQLAFSDPSADGPAIQAACVQALENGFSTEKGLAFVAEVHKRHPNIPLFVMTYASLAYTPGIENFVRMNKEVGVSGLIIPDLPFDNDEGLTAACKKYGMENIPVAAPSMTPERLDKLVHAGFPYLYAALRAGITGQTTVIDAETLSFIDAAAKRGAKILGGFGIRNGEQSHVLCSHVYAVVAGSVFVNIILDLAKTPEKIPAAIEAKAKELSE